MFLGNVLQSDGSGKVSILVKDKLGFTPDGGLCIKLTNKTGGNSIQGTIAHPYGASAIDLAFDLIPDNEPDQIGVIYGDDDGNPVADGEGCWLTVNGIAKVYFESAVALEDFARTQITSDGGTLGYAVSEVAPLPPFATDKHFLEIGHILEATGGAGLARCLLHSN